LGKRLTKLNAEGTGTNLKVHILYQM
jgi:hypothetical protein